MTLTVELPPPSLALAAHQAAATLRAAATKASSEMAPNDYWHNGWASGVRNAIGGPEGDLAAEFNPGQVLALADWLDHLGATAASQGDQVIPRPAAEFIRGITWNSA